MALTQIVTTDSVSASVVNTKIVDPANTALAGLQIAQTAGGTATAITLTGIELTNGYQKTFIISASNSGLATTVNGKPLYKPGGTVAPNLVAGKSASIWYNLAGDCFFYKASAEGTAVAGDVLASKTFSNDNDTGLIGTFTNITSMQSGIATPWATSALTQVGITISTVDPSKSIVLIGQSLDNAEGYKNISLAYLASDSVVNIRRYSGVTPILGKYFWRVIEFNNIKSIQRGTFSNSLLGYDTAKDITISPLTNLSKSFILVNNYAQSLDNNAKDYFIGAEIKNATTISIYGPSTTWGAWQVIEFK